MPVRVISVRKIRENIYRSDAQVTIALYGLSYVYRSFIRNKITFKYCLTHYIWKISGSFEIHCARQYLVNFTDLVDIVSASLCSSLKHTMVCCSIGCFPQTHLNLKSKFRSLITFIYFNCSTVFPLHWRHYDHDGVSNHQPHGCLFNRLFRRRSKKTSKVRVTGLCVGNSPGPVNSPHKGPVTRKMFPFDDVIMQFCRVLLRNQL